MKIKFLRDYATSALVPERFTAGQVVERETDESALHFVRRGVAAFVGEKGALIDHEGKAVDEEATAILVNVSDNRDGGEDAREAPLPDGTPQRASSGPGEVVTTTSVTEGEAHKAHARKK